MYNGVSRLPWRHHLVIPTPYKQLLSPHNDSFHPIRNQQGASIETRQWFPVYAPWLPQSATSVYSIIMWTRWLTQCWHSRSTQHQPSIFEKEPSDETSVENGIIQSDLRDSAYILTFRTSAVYSLTPKWSCNFHTMISNRIWVRGWFEAPEAVANPASVKLCIYKMRKTNSLSSLTVNQFTAGSIDHFSN